MYKVATWHWHIELSSKCTLKCPRCARSEVPNTLVNTEISIEFFKQMFTTEFILSDVEKITFCGDDGDPIYAHDLIDIIAYIKSVKSVEIIIITNGSHKKEAWWLALSAVLNDIDEVHFSIDGFDQASNEVYRVNSDFASIMLGLKTLRANSKVFIRWAAIAFSFNENHLHLMKKLAIDLACDSFQLTKSTKFGINYGSYPKLDALQPKSNLLSTAGRFTRDIFNLSGRVRESNSSKTNLRLVQSVKETHNEGITPLCYIGNKGIYLSALGKLYPCCWVANRYNHNNEWDTLSFDLHQMTLEDALADEFWQKRFKNFEWQECKTKCNSRDSISYYTEW
jgi:MoaA/NifB/PqqE/SkfB family radical SAM enzyme